MLRVKRFRLALLISALLATGCSGDKNSQEYFELGQDHQHNGDPKSAIIEYKNSIRQDPSNNNARLVMGKLYLESGQYDSARKELIRASRDEKLRRAALMPLAMVTFKLNLHQKLLELPLLTSGLPSQDLIIGHVLRGQSLMILEKREQAIAEFTLANDIDEQAVYARLGQVMAASAKADFSRAMALAKTLSEDQPELEQAMLIYASLSFSNGDFENAIATYDKYIAQKKGASNNINLLLADSLINNKNMVRAKQELDKLFAINDKHPIVNAMLAQVSYQNNEFSTSLEYALTALALTPDNSVANLMAAMSAFQLAKFEDSYHYFARIEKQISGNVAPQIMQIINTVKRGNIEDARHALKSLAGVDQKNVKLYLLAAKEFTIAQDYRTGLRLLKQARPFLLNNNELMYKIGLLKVETNDETGFDDLSTALLDPNLVDDVVPHVVKLFVAAKRIDDLQRIADDLKVKFSDKSHGWDIAALIALYKQDYKTAEQIYHTDLDKFPGNTSALINLANLRVRQGDNSGAMAYVEQVLALKPSHFAAIKFKARLLFRQTKDIEQYKIVVKDAFTAFPDSEMLIIEMAIVHASQNEMKQALTLLESIKSRETLSDYYWSRYGDLLAAAQQSDQALAIFQQWAQRQPNSPVPLLKQIAMNEQLGRYNDGLRLLEQTTKKFGKLKNLEELKINLLMLDGQLGTVRRLIGTYKLNNKNSPHIPGIEGELSFREKNYQQAKLQLTKAYSFSKNSRYAMLLAQANVELDELEQALTVLKAHLEQEPLNQHVKALMANIYVDLKSPLAVDAYSELVTVAPNNPVYLNNLAWSLSENGQYNEALVHIEKAVKILPENTSILDTYGVILLKLNQPELADIQFYKAISLASHKE